MLQQMPGSYTCTGVASQGSRCAVLAQDLVVYCNGTQNQYYGDSSVPFNTAVYAPGTPETAATTDNAINCCLRCAFSSTCNIWCALPLGILLPITEAFPTLLAALEGPS